MAITVATFFSFKGGAGRSTTCLNTVPFLAKKLNADERHPILLVDTDIESCGMTYLLNSQEFFRKNTVDVKELLQEDLNFSIEDEGSFANHSLFKHFMPVGEYFGVASRAVLFLGVDDGKEVNRSRISGQYQQCMASLRKAAKNNGARAVIMDSAAGDQFAARLSVDIANNIVVCMRPTSQFRAGTFSYLKRLNARVGENLSSNKKIILLPTVVPADLEIDGVSQLGSAVSDIAERVSALDNLPVNTTFVQDSKFFGINEIKRFKWMEGVLFRLPKEQLADDEKQAIERYSKLAEVIASYGN